MSYELQLYREGKRVVYHHHCSNLCIHVETTTLADGTYELVPESESEQQEAQENLTEAVETRVNVQTIPGLTIHKKASPGA